MNTILSSTGAPIQSPNSSVAPDPRTSYSNQYTPEVPNFTLSPESKSGTLETLGKYAGSGVFGGVIGFFAAIFIVNGDISTNSISIASTKKDIEYLKPEVERNRSDISQNSGKISSHDVTLRDIKYLEKSISRNENKLKEMGMSVN